MASSEKIDTDSARKLARRLRIAGASILTLGIIIAGLIYWIGTRNADLSNDPSMQGFNRSEQRQMGELYGKSGEMVENWSEDLQKPGTQAIIAILVSGLVAAGCFYFARLAKYGGQPD
ncbi:MAG TPA: hypothetical protein VMB22_01015 [Verrucomicrobiae bacterium]|nr:hypothetical protein [Verrucomicrobiae bacterium]